MYAPLYDILLGTSTEETQDGYTLSGGFLLLKL